jgi:putative ABC transport system ATP-binding protein
MQPIVKLVDVYKVYVLSSGVRFWALKGVNLEVYRGDFIAVMGPSGHGKTTLLNMIGLLDRPTRGRVYIDGVETSRLSDNALSMLRNRKIGFVFQQFNLINRMTVLENIEIPLIVRGIPRRERLRMVRRALRMVGGDESWLEKHPLQLSGGEQQRVAIARAIVGDPEIILADEPTGNLDTSSSKVIMDTFIRLNRAGKTIVMVTHAHEIANCAKKILLIRDGRIIGEKSPEPEKSIIHLY